MMTTRQLLIGTAAGLALAMTAVTQAASTLTLKTGSACAGPGDTITVTLELSTTPAPGAAGYQAFLDYDDSLLTLTAVALEGSAFPVTLIDSFNLGPFTAGEIDLSAGLCLAGLAGCGGGAGSPVITPPSWFLRRSPSPSMPAPKAVLGLPATSSNSGPPPPRPPA